ncbi:MAG: tRNA-queuosine alpha-mannosyltransferase domain-containing protein [Planctomycetota bacterium]
MLGFESFDAGSHRSVREMISAHSRHEWTWLTRPARGWKWRMRLAAVELLDQAGDRLDSAVDAIVATSLMSAADLRALLPARLRATPVILYMHENQAAYPLSDHPKVDPKRDVHFALTNLTSVLASDLVIWNSAWNKTSFLDGMDRILRRANAVDLTSWQDKVEQRSRTIWPPVEPPPPDLIGEARISHNSTRVIWPHRWEHDKGPDELLEFADRYSEPLNLRWTILGEQYPDVPPSMTEFEQRFTARIDHFGFEPNRRKYWQHLARADWVLSTARHEYFGIAVVEALLAGCLPWLPPRLSYPELLPPEARGLSPLKPPADRQGVIEKIRAHLEPALAPNAVRRIDETVAEAVRTA